MTQWALALAAVAMVAVLPATAAVAQGSTPAPPIVCSGPVAQAYACLDYERTRAFSDVVAKTTEFTSMAVISCAHSVYLEWQASLIGLAVVGYAANARFSETKQKVFSDLVRTIDMETLESRFAVADAALRNGGRYCRMYADAEYRQILKDYREPAFAFARDRAKVGIDDVRALPKIED